MHDLLSRNLKTDVVACIDFFALPALREKTPPAAEAPPAPPAAEAPPAPPAGHCVSACTVSLLAVGIFEVIKII